MNKPIVVSRSEARRILQESGGLFFSVVFVKRTDNTTREMVCRTGVSKGVKGKGSFDPEPHNLLRVYDVEKDSHRHISLEQLLTAKVNGQTYLFRD